ncbi:MAG: DUF6285 domain-containing protein [Myxococcota bacterium]
MHDRPSAVELLAAIADLLEREVMPALSGGLEYRVRVAVNLARILEREARLGPDLLERERELLEALVGPGESVLALNARLVERLRSGNVDLDFERSALAALGEIARAKLAIARPGYERYDASVDA